MTNLQAFKAAAAKFAASDDDRDGLEACNALHSAMLAAYAELSDSERFGLRLDGEADRADFEVNAIMASVTDADIAAAWGGQ